MSWLLVINENFCSQLEIHEATEGLDEVKEVVEDLGS